MTAYVIRRTVGKATGKFEYLRYVYDTDGEVWERYWTALPLRAFLFESIQVAEMANYDNEKGEIVEIELVEKGVMG